MTMWFPATTKMPYYDDPDYRDSLVTSIKRRFGDVPIDISWLPSYGRLEVLLDDWKSILGVEQWTPDVEHRLVDELAALPLVGSVSRPYVDRMLLGPRTVI